MMMMVIDDDDDDDDRCDTICHASPSYCDKAYIDDDNGDGDDDKSDEPDPCYCKNGSLPFLSLLPPCLCLFPFLLWQSNF